MATKAERFRAEEQRARQKPKKKVAPARKAGPTHLGKKASVKLETSATVPSRKSTRKSANRSMPSSNLERREARKRRSPELRAEAAAARATKVRGRKKSAAKLR
ncbi:MAG TPA: hypothetical protein VM686_20210 [Polyangiaceae bacterium]|jgi:hypothetical protein|nr:hypothetical protein [Polyangiaceae bacterium]